MATQVRESCLAGPGAGRDSATEIWYLYLIRTADSALYTGISTDPARRLAEHCAGGSRAARSLRGRQPLQLVFSHGFPDRVQASRAEYRVKQLTKQQKERLVSGQLEMNRVMESERSGN